MYNSTSSKMKQGRNWTSIHCLPVNTRAMEKMILNRQSKNLNYGNSSKTFSHQSLRTRPTAECHRHLLFTFCASILPTCFGNHYLTNILILWKSQDLNAVSQILLIACAGELFCNPGIVTFCVRCGIKQARKSLSFLIFIFFCHC